MILGFPANAGRRMQQKFESDANPEEEGGRGGRGGLLWALAATQGFPSVSVAALPVGLLGDCGKDIPQASSSSPKEL
jgi:hypothetical protein